MFIYIHIVIGVKYLTVPEFAQEDAGGFLKDPAELGRQRLTHVADAEKGKSLDPAQFLNPTRHGEWTSYSGEPQEKTSFCSLLLLSLNTVSFTEMCLWLGGK